VYRIDGPPQSILEAAAGRGFLNATPQAVQCVLNDLGVQTTRPFHEKVLIILQANQERWGWSELDIARAMSLVLPEHRASRAPRSKLHPEVDPGPTSVWSDLVSALQHVQEQQADEVSNAAVVAVPPAILAAVDFARRQRLKRKAPAAPRARPGKRPRVKVELEEEAKDLSVRADEEDGLLTPIASPWEVGSACPHRACLHACCICCTVS
jgi:hypothetical protein